MLKGKNKLIFNGATLCMAIQYYLDNHVFNPNERTPKVTNVTLWADGGLIDRGYTDVAEITLEGNE